MAHHCPECGFVNAEGANYCQKCGSYLVSEESTQASGDTTVTFKIEEGGELAVEPETATAGPGASLVVRSGGMNTGDSFGIEGERMLIGRSTEAEVFLDDVTVSRNHALVVRRRDGLYLDDLGSLNGTYVNRRRIDSHKLEDGDELQIGKYKLAYLEK